MIRRHPFQEDDRLLQLGAQQSLQIHDELVMQAPAENADEATKVLGEVMTDPLPKLRVPITASATHGNLWTECH